MLDQIRRLLRDFTAPEEGGRLDDPRIAAAALLVHVAEADGQFTPAERARVREALSRKFGVGEAEASALLEEGRRADAEAVDLYRFTSVLMARLDEERRVAFIDLLWEVIHADGAVHELEDNLAWRIAELLGVSARDRMIGKQKAARAAVSGE